MKDIIVVVLVIYNLITFTDHFQWRAPRAISRGIFPHAARRSGRLRGVTIVSHSVRCRYATESRCHTAAAFARSHSR